MRQIWTTEFLCKRRLGDIDRHQLAQQAMDAGMSLAPLFANPIFCNPALRGDRMQFDQMRRRECITLVCTENLIRFDCMTESHNVNGDDRALLSLTDPVRLA